MTLIADLDRSWREHACLRAIHRRPTLTQSGLALGAGTLLLRSHPDYFGRPCLDPDRQEERLLVLLQTAGECPAGPWVVEALRPVAQAWRQGATDLACLQLAYAGLPRLRHDKDAPRLLYLMAGMLDAGLGPDEARAILNAWVTEEAVSKKAG